MTTTFEPAPSPRARRVATYERVSTENQAERETIKMQTTALDAWIAREPDVAVAARYSDDGVSGNRKLADRPDGARLLRDAAAGVFNELVVYKVDRLGRNLADMATTAAYLEDRGIPVRSVVEGSLGLFQFKLMALLAEEESRSLRRRFADGANEAAKQGRYPGGIRAYGYRIEGQKPRCFPVPDERIVAGDWIAADVVRHMYRRVAIDHWSCRLVAEELDTLGIPTLYVREERAVRKQRTSGRWGDGRIRNMLVNPMYKGILTFGKRSTKVREIISAPVEPLVSVELWEAAQDVLASHRIVARNTERIYLLRGVMTCVHCGLRMIGSTNKDTTYYRCGGTRQGRGRLGGACFGRDVQGPPLERQVWADIERGLRDPGDILDELDGRTEQEAADARRQAEVAGIEAAITALDDQKRRMIRLVIKGTLAEDEVRAERQRISSERAVLQARLDGLASPADAQVIDAGLAETLRSRLDAGLTDAERQQIVSLLVPSIEIETTFLPSGLKHTTARISYRNPVAAVRTRTDRGSSQR